MQNEANPNNEHLQLRGSREATLAAFSRPDLHLEGAQERMKIVIIGAGSVAFTPAILSELGTGARYRSARVSQEFKVDWNIQPSADRREVLEGADVVTTSIGVGGLKAWQQHPRSSYFAEVLGRSAAWPIRQPIAPEARCSRRDLIWYHGIAGVGERE
jgi:hypothetical protein